MPEFKAADFGIDWPTTPRAIIEEALREFVGDGAGAADEVLSAFEADVRLPLEAEIQRVTVASHRYASDREDLRQEVLNLEERLVDAEKDEATSRSVANFLSAKISAFEYRRDQVQNELNQRELHHFETEQENAELRTQVLQVTESLAKVHSELSQSELLVEALSTGHEHLVGRIAELERREAEVLASWDLERRRVATLEAQASSLQMVVEDLEQAFETLAVGHERSHSSYLRGTEAANEIRAVLRAVADAAAARG